MPAMSFALSVQILALVIIFITLSTFATYHLLIHFTKWATKYQEAQVAAMLEDIEDEDNLDEHFAQTPEPGYFPKKQY